jgi:hypothetical protein
MACISSRCICLILLDRPNRPQKHIFVIVGRLVARYKGIEGRSGRGGLFKVDAEPIGD